MFPTFDSFLLFFLPLSVLLLLAVAFEDKLIKFEDKTVWALVRNIKRKIKAKKAQKKRAQVKKCNVHKTQQKKPAVKTNAHKSTQNRNASVGNRQRYAA